MVKNNVALVPKSRKRYLGTTLKVRMDLFSRIHNIWKKKKDCKSSTYSF